MNTPICLTGPNIPCTYADIPMFFANAVYPVFFLVVGFVFTGLLVAFVLKFKTKNEKVREFYLNGMALIGSVLVSTFTVVSFFGDIEPTLKMCHDLLPLFIMITWVVVLTAAGIPMFKFNSMSKKQIIRQFLVILFATIMLMVMTIVAIKVL